MLTFSPTRPFGIAGRMALLMAALAVILASVVVVGDADARVAGSARTADTVKYPTRASSGVPRRWTPRRVVRGDRVVNRDGAVVKDLRIKGDLIIAAKNVRVKRVDVVGGSINNFAGSECQTGLRIRRSTIRRDPNQSTDGDWPAVATGGYVAKRVLIDGLPEGFRVGGKRDCGRVVIRRSYARVTSPDNCGDWHGDSLQGYDGGRLKIRNSRLDLIERDGCGGTAPFFYPSDQGNTSVNIDGLIVKGGGISFRLGTPGSVKNLKVVRGSWYYAPIDVNCGRIRTWQANIVKLNSKGQPVNVRRQRCNS